MMQLHMRPAWAGKMLIGCMVSSCRQICWQAVAATHALCMQTAAA